MVRPHRILARTARLAYWSLRERTGWGMPATVEGALEFDPPTSILHFRTDAIGDHVLGTPILTVLRARFPKARLDVACPSRVAPLFEGDARVDRVLPFDRAAFLKDARKAKAWSRNAGGPWDLLVCPMLSREPLSDLLLRHFPARMKVGFAEDLANQPDALVELRGRSAFTHVLRPAQEPLHDLDQNTRFLRALGHKGPAPSPDPGFSEGEFREAEAWLAARGLDPARTLALGLGAQDAIREYPAFGEALRLVLRDRAFALLALGAEAERPRVTAALGNAGLSWVDGLDALPLRHAGAVIARCAAFAGVDSALAHLAIAARRRSLIVLGGGHFGRFQPWGDWTVAVTRPLPCFQCRWRCIFPEPVCIRSLNPALVAEALIHCLDRKDGGPIVIHPMDADPCAAGPHAPEFHWVPASPG